LSAACLRIFFLNDKKIKYFCVKREFFKD
jgi:hypothetical protein